MTAHFVLLDVGALQADETVEMSDGTGAVGFVARQPAKLHGCRVIAIATKVQRSPSDG
jgi:NADPH-dependent curcumin reductase CurA